MLSHTIGSITKPDNDSKAQPNQIEAYLGVRRAIGWMGLLLPAILIIGGLFGDHRPAVLESISGYYYGPMRDVFVGVLFAWGVFFLIYRYERVDHRLGVLACICAIATAVFPTAPSGVTRTWVGWAHIIASSTLFCALALIALLIFTRTEEEVTKTNPPRSKLDRHRRLPDGKRQRNTIYMTCGTIMVLGILSALISTLVNVPSHWFLASEIVIVEAFGYSWLVKGGVWFSDSKYKPAALACT